MPKDQKSQPKLKKIKEGGFSRGFALARMSAEAGARATGHLLGNLFASPDEKEARFKDLLRSQIELLARELGTLKGSVMKVGQMLSVVGEQFLPPEINSVLKSLQSNSPPLEWSAIEPVLKRQLGEKLEDLEIDPEAIASASMGQVHRARLRTDADAIREGRWPLAIKVQYPGVDQAIDSDILAMRRLLSLSKLMPMGNQYDEIFQEVRQMLRQETDYVKEREATEEFRARLTSDARFVVPRTYPEFSTARVLTTEFQEGIAVDSDEVKALPQERRNALARAALELYFRELFEWHAVQTDPHFGNYKIRLGRDGSPDQLVLLDFGAVRKLPKTFLRPYFVMLQGTYARDPAQIREGAEGLEFLRDTDSDEILREFAQVCYLFGEPFASEEPYDFGRSDLPKRASREGARLAMVMKLRSPPREVVFLDRKMGGLFIMLSVLGARFQGRDLLEGYLRQGCKAVGL